MKRPLSEQVRTHAPRPPHRLDERDVTEVIEVQLAKLARVEAFAESYKRAALAWQLLAARTDITPEASALCRARAEASSMIARDLAEALR